MPCTLDPEAKILNTVVAFGYNVQDNSQILTVGGGRIGKALAQYIAHIHLSAFDTRPRLEPYREHLW